MEEYLEHEFDDFPSLLEFEQIKAVLQRHEESGFDSEQGEDFHVRLFETQTISLFELTPLYLIPGTEEAETAQKLSEEYEAKKSNDIRRKDGFTQILPKHPYKELQVTDPIEKKDVACSASNWQLYDAYNKEESLEVQDDLKADTEDKNNLLEEDQIKKEEEKIMQELVTRFQQAAMTMCRVLSSNNFQDQQIEFTKKHQPSRSISYKMDLMWTLSGGDAGPVNSICSNSVNSKIFGVGYGDSEGPGSVKVWHVKNPEAPERKTSTARSVTCVQFSRSQPRLLAATTKDGSVLVIDITDHSPVVTLVNQEEICPYPVPLWSLTWGMYEDGSEEGTERLFTVGHEGLLWVWDPIRKTGNRQIAKLSFVAAPDTERTVRFQKLLDGPLDSSDDEDIDPQHYFLEVPYIGLSISFCRPNKLYVTTDVGCIMEVRSNSADNKWEKLTGHRLPVFGLEHSPYISCIYLTYSADGDLCIWIHGYKEPLVNLRVSDISLYSIDSACWSPSHSSVLASASSQEVCLWDLSRSTDKPMAVLTGAHYTRVCFSRAGTNLLVGCKNGDILVYRLSEMPHPPYLQKEHLEKALRKALESRLEVLKELEIGLRDY